MCDSLELAKTKLTISHLATHLDLAQAESLFKSLRETLAFLERRIAREKRSIDVLPQVGVISQSTVS